MLTALQKDTRPNPGYIRFHRPRFSFVLQVLRPALNARSRVLDIGRSHLTSLIGEQFGVCVDSMGLEPDQQLSTGPHYSFDLNDVPYRDRWRSGLGPYDVIVFAEVIEHLYTAPELVLEFLAHLLRPGGLLVLQTPNAASIGKRIKLALGTNPFEKIRGDRLNPGHFREYTLRELVELLQSTGFSIEKTHRKYYFDARFARHDRGGEKPRWLGGTIRNVVYRVLPPSWREGITIIAKKR